VPCALLIEVDTGYLLLVSHLAESIIEFGLDLYDALLMSLDIHPYAHKQPHDGLFSFEQNPDAICWQKGNSSDVALQRRLKDAAVQLETMSPAQANTMLGVLNEQVVTLTISPVVPAAVIRQRLDHYATEWLAYTENTNFFVQIWNTLRKKKPWVENLEK
jgi:hypothetical protein